MILKKAKISKVEWHPHLRNKEVGFHRTMKQWQVANPAEKEKPDDPGNEGSQSGPGDPDHDDDDLFDTGILDAPAIGPDTNQRVSYPFLVAPNFTQLSTNLFDSTRSES